MAPKEPLPNIFVQAAQEVALYDICLKHKIVHLLPKGLVEEARSCKEYTSYA
ncbi:hypothetical protein HD806DRAFT_516325 [Xylariaceae sp. AK1471]|nr:hypothetical protein HD806DRAFT_516325 [Xylariaceae sp. AK1471]